MTDDSNLPETVAQQMNDVQTLDTAVPDTPGANDPEVRQLDVVDEDHHAVQEVGKAAMEKTAGKGAGKFLSEYIYEHDKAWVREWLQNQEAACYRWAKHLIQESDEYPDGWLVLTMWVDAETGETVVDHDEDQSILAEYGGEAKNLRQISIPRSMDDVFEAAKTLGYEPTAVWDMFLDERQAVTYDNGIGMTPTQFHNDFNSPFDSGSEVDGNSGGKFGVGSESAAIVHGEDGGMTVTCRSRIPDEDGNPRKGFRGYSYLGGANFLGDDVKDGFFGTRFEIPVQEDFDMSKVQEWVEEYSELLRIPILYREHDAGSTPVEEEYEVTTFFEKYEDAPVKIEKPGEYSVAAGPDVVPSTSYKEPDPPDTYLVSMPIDRNCRYSISTFWNVVVQIHDEQGRIVAGPNRGQYEANIDGLHEDDVVAPQPTGDRDRLSQSDEQKDFFKHIEEVVTKEEMGMVAEIAERMNEADHPADAIRGEAGDWKLFKKMISYHGFRVTETRSKFDSFVDDYPEVFPDYDKETQKQIYKLFQKVQLCHRGPSASTKKSRRNEISLGKLLAVKDPDEVYMAASTGGNFSQRFRVVKNTSDAEIIVISGASKYDRWNRLFGFKILKEVPLTRSDDDEPDHRYDIPDKIHENNVKTATSDTGKSDDVTDRALKLRTGTDSSAIDMRMSIANAQDHLEKGGKFHGHKKLMLFPRTADENISDHYDMAKYAAIASVSKAEYDELAGYENVVTYEEYCEWSKSALIATEDGAMAPDELVEDDRMVILAYRYYSNGDVVELLSDEKEKIRRFFAEDLRDQVSWARVLDGYDGGYGGDDVGEVPDDDKDDTLFAVAGEIVLSRAEWAFDQHHHINKREMIGLKSNRKKYGYKNPCEWVTLNGSRSTYRLKADTPHWENDSKIYDMMPSSRDSPKAQMFLGFHDIGVDPSDYDPEELRKFINGE